MYITKADPERVLPSEHIETNAKYTILARRNQLDEAGPINVFEMPGRLRLEADYLLQDGGKRLEAAKRENARRKANNIPGKLEILLKVIETPADFRFTTEYNHPEFTGMDTEEFKMMIEMAAEEALERRATNSYF